MEDLNKLSDEELIKRAEEMRAKLDYSKKSTDLGNGRCLVYNVKDGIVTPQIVEEK